MKNIILTLFLFFTSILFSQTIIEYDYMETSSATYLAAGWFTPAPTAGWFTNASVSPTTAAAIYGSGSSTSGLEQDWYSIPTVALNPSKSYQLKFRLASYTFSNSTATTRGLDVADYLSVQVSSNGGTYVTEMRITGNSNATWAFTNTGSVTHTANGSFTNSAAPAGDVYSATTGASTLTPATYTLNLAPNLTSVAIDFYCRVNSAGEEWWIDNIELWDITPISLPVELISFEGSNEETYNLLNWSTASEKDNDYFLIERSKDGTNWTNINVTSGMGNSNTKVDYSFRDFKFTNSINYYRLTQVDFDGVQETFDIISIDNTRDKKKILKITNTIGQEVSLDTKGLLIITYTDGTSEKIIN